MLDSGSGRLSFSGVVFGSETARFPALEFCFFDGATSRLSSNLFGLFHSFNTAPFVRAVAWYTLGRTLGQPKQVWSAKLRIAGTAVSGDFNEPGCFKLADRWPD